MEDITLLGIDIAKNVFQLHGLNSAGKKVFKRKLTRKKLLETIANLKPCRIVMEACSGSSHWCRKFMAMGHEANLISPQYVKPFVKTNKNDANDAEAICEAASRPSMNYVEPNTVEQQDIQNLHRIRSRLIKERTAIVNQIRGLLAEYGIIANQGISQLRKALPEILEDGENELTSLSRETFAELAHELSEKDVKIEAYDKKIERIFKTNEDCKRIGKIEGIGPITATAIIASLGQVKHFKNGRHLAAYLGLVPKQSSSGGKEKLLGISKRGDQYLRTLLVNGAQSVLRYSKRKEDRKSVWLQGVAERRGTNRAAVALANKNARIIWALLAHKDEYRVAA